MTARRIFSFRFEKKKIVGLGRLSQLSEVVGVIGETLAEYNAKQKRADREIPDYYEHVKKSGK